MRGERCLQVEQAPTIDHVGTGSAEVGGGREQQLDDVIDAEKGRSLQHQRRGPRDVWRREGGAADQRGIAVQFGRQDLDARRHEEVFTRAAGPIAEAGQITIGIERAHRYGAAARLRAAGEDGRKDRVVAAFVAGSDHHDAPGIDGPLQCIAKGAIE